MAVVVFAKVQGQGKFESPATRNFLHTYIQIYVVPEVDTRHLPLIINSYSVYEFQISFIGKILKEFSKNNDISSFATFLHHSRSLDVT